MTKRTITLLIFLISLNYACLGQKFGVLEPEEIDNITINSSLSMYILLNPGVGWQQIQSTFGNMNPTCTSSGGVSDCKFNYQGVELLYTDYHQDFQLASAIFTTADHGITYKGVEIKVGDSIDKIESLFKSAYATRGERVVGTETTYEAIVLFKDTQVSLSFVYNSQDSEIMRIEIFDVLT